MLPSEFDMRERAETLMREADHARLVNEALAARRPSQRVRPLRFVRWLLQRPESESKNQIVPDVTLGYPDPECC